MQTQTKPKVEVAPEVETERPVTLDQLVANLYGRKGCAFASIDASYDMDSKLKKRNNPFYGKGLRKESKTEVMVTFDYAASMERRGDEASGKGNWSQAVVREDGSLTPLSVHKNDVIAMEDGKPMELKDNPRVYLRCEFRSSTSRYVDADGNEVDAELVKPHLKATGSKGAVNFHLVGLNNVRKMRIDGESYRII